MLIYYKDKPPVNLINVDSVNYFDKMGILTFVFKHKETQWKFPDQEEGQKVFNTIVKNYFIEIKID